MRNGMILTLVLLVTIAATAIGCTALETIGGAKGTWIDSAVIEIEGNSLLIPTSEVTGGRLAHFADPVGQGEKKSYMAYSLDGEIYVRSMACPPCVDVSYTLKGDTLYCNNCGTKYDARTGYEISGGCVDFPKDQVMHTIRGDKIAMGFDDLLTAYEKTKNPGWQ